MSCYNKNVQKNKNLLQRVYFAGASHNAWYNHDRFARTKQNSLRELRDNFLED
jgi:hypothetical protein